MLAGRMAEAPAAAGAPAGAGAPAAPRGKAPPSAIEEILKSPVTRTVAGVVARGLMGALLGTPSRRRRSYF
jgi:hypothetical protein